MNSDKDPDTIRESADGLAECLKNAGPNSVGEEEFKQIAAMTFKLIDESVARSAKIQSEKKNQAGGAPLELQPDEDEENNSEDDEESCRRSLEEVFGALMEIVPALFVTHLLQ